jgi:hypothetical protein
MNLLGDDTRLAPNQYKIGFNITNRFDELDLVPSSVEDKSIPQGIKQGIITFGNYIIAFVSGMAFYKFYSDIGWQVIPGFNMSQTAPKYWFIAVPVSTTNYLRLAATATISSQAFSSQNGVINVLQVAGASGGNLPGLLVQDNINQPQFIFLDSDGTPVVRTTQSYSQWSITFTDATNTVIAPNGDQREYVPIGNCMAWDNGVLYIVSQDFSQIYRSVSGRPLDFVVNVVNNLVTSNPYTMLPGGDATTTSYSVGVGGISAIREISSGGIYVSASGANFAVTQNKTPGAPTEFGEYTFIRTFLFNAFCLSERAILDDDGDTRFIDLTGIRSFNAVEQQQNEGRNSVFSSQIQAALSNITATEIIVPITQNSINSAILFDNYELFSVDTIFGPAIAKYDGVNQCWTSFDLGQTGGKRVKQFAALQINVLALFAITEDDKFYQLYGSTTNFDTGIVRTVGVCSSLLYLNTEIKMNNPEYEIKPTNARAVVNKITESCKVSFNLFVNNRQSAVSQQTKSITYSKPVIVLTDPYALPDVNTQLSNAYFNLSGAEQGWKMFGVYSWNDGVITQFSYELQDVTPQNPLSSQENVV